MCFFIYKSLELSYCTITMVSIDASFDNNINIITIHAEYDGIHVAIINFEIKFYFMDDNSVLSLMISEPTWHSQATC